MFINNKKIVKLLVKQLELQKKQAYLQDKQILELKKQNKYLQKLLYEKDTKNKKSSLPHWLQAIIMFYQAVIEACPILISIFISIAFIDPKQISLNLSQGSLSICLIVFIIYVMFKVIYNSFIKK